MISCILICMRFWKWLGGNRNTFKKRGWMGTTNAASHRETAGHRSDNDRKERGQAESQIAGQQSHLGQIQTKRCDFENEKWPLLLLQPCPSRHPLALRLGGGTYGHRDVGLFSPSVATTFRDVGKKGDQIEVEDLSCKRNEREWK